MAGPLKARLNKGERAVGSSCAKVWDLLERPNQPGEDWETTREAGRQTGKLEDKQRSYTETSEKDARCQENKAETHNNKGD